MLRTFNCGVGMVVVVAGDQAGPTLDHLATAGLNAWKIGDIAAGTKGVEFSE
jgi:phosphoribosylformylglycinamidine cyclo-ligase